MDLPVDHTNIGLDCTLRSLLAYNDHIIRTVVVLLGILRSRRNFLGIYRHILKILVIGFSKDFGSHDPLLAKSLQRIVSPEYR